MNSDSEFILDSNLIAVYEIPVVTDLSNSVLADGS